MISYKGLNSVVQLAKANKEQSSVIAAAILIVLFLLWIVYTCLFPLYIPQEEWLEPNQVGFLVPNDDNTDPQNKNKNYLANEELLESTRIHGQYAEIPQRKIAVGRITYHWEPSAKLLTVVRTPITLEWGTQHVPSKKGGDNKGFILISEEGLEYKVVATIIAGISEKDAAKFVVNFPGSTLSEAMAVEIHGYIQGALNEAFRGLSLDKARSGSLTIFNAVSTETIAHFASKGIDIMELQFGSGLTIVDQSYQSIINETVKSQLKTALIKQQIMEQDELKDLMAKKTELAQTVSKGKADAASRKTKGE